MILAQTLKSGLFSLLVSIVVLSSAGISFSQPQEQGTALGELKLQGKYIERLILERKDGRREEFKLPEETIELTEGEYRLHEVHLKGGYICTYSRFPTRDWVTVAPDKPAVLKVGAPLKQTIKVQRKGRVLALRYELLGVGGEQYTSRNRSKPPTIAVYKRDKKIHSGKFEFG
jgi:hypothetical protein